MVELRIDVFCVETKFVIDRHLQCTRVVLKHPRRNRRFAAGHQDAQSVHFSQDVHDGYELPQGGAEGHEFAFAGQQGDDRLQF